MINIETEEKSKKFDLHDIFDDPNAAIVKIKVRHKNKEYEFFVNLVTRVSWPDYPELIEDLADPDDNVTYKFIERVDEIIDLQCICDVFDFTNERLNLIKNIMSVENCAIELDDVNYVKFNKTLFIIQDKDIDEDNLGDMVDINFVATAIMLSPRPITLKLYSRETVY